MAAELADDDLIMCTGVRLRAADAFHDFQGAAFSKKLNVSPSVSDLLDR